MRTLFGTGPAWLSAGPNNSRGGGRGGEGPEPLPPAVKLPSMTSYCRRMRRQATAPELSNLSFSALSTCFALPLNVSVSFGNVVFVIPTYCAFKTSHVLQITDYFCLFRLLSRFLRTVKLGNPVSFAIHGLLLPAVEKKFSLVVTYCKFHKPDLFYTSRTTSVYFGKTACVVCMYQDATKSDLFCNSRPISLSWPHCLAIRGRNFYVIKSNNNSDLFCNSLAISLCFGNTFSVLFTYSKYLPLNNIGIP